VVGRFEVGTCLRLNWCLRRGVHHERRIPVDEGRKPIAPIRHVQHPATGDGERKRLASLRVAQVKGSIDGGKDIAVVGTGGVIAEQNPARILHVMSGYRLAQNSQGAIWMPHISRYQRFRKSRMGLHQSLLHPIGHRYKALRQR
jgi:hypothetical protein